MTLAQTSRPFLNYLDAWLANLPAAKLSKVAAVPDNTAVISVDIINGFCTVGPLASPRVQDVVKPILKLFKAAYKRGVRNLVLTQDTHEPDAVEFASYPPHCVRGNIESESVPEFKKLPFYDTFEIVEKNSISSAHNTSFNKWLAGRSHIDTFIVVGDCTDLCIYQMAMHLRLDANARQQKTRRVIVPADCVQTYDTPVKVATKLGIPAHDGDLLHAVFLYNMASNGIEVVKSLT